jgi:hypothetical protein
MRRLNYLKVAAGAALLLFIAVSVVCWQLLGMGVSEARGLRSSVHSHPAVPIVFTSRSEPASLQAAPPEADGFAYPGTIPWAAAEGRLRLLDTDGKVYELTWGRELWDGSTLIDVMSPSITLDGKRILFAGRKAPPDPGRWRIYEVGVDGRGLRQVTGLPDDPGCVLAPPMRYAADGSQLPMEERKRLDYDDVDPVDQALSIVFTSSRLPDLGKDHTRRATQIWIWPTGQNSPYPLTANRNSDRWPFLTFAQDILVFSMWSRNREAVTEDLTDIRPVTPGEKFATAPTDQWMAGRVTATGVQFGYAIKAPEPVWRPRPLFNGKLAYMTTHPSGGGRLRLAQADWGYLRTAPSSLAVGSHLPTQVGGSLIYAADHDADGRELTMGCPSPYPDHFLLFSGAPVGSQPGAFGIYLLPEEWSPPQTPMLLFDDPELVDADPVAVYPRVMTHSPPEPRMLPSDYLRPKDYRLASGKEYDGPIGQLHNYIINKEMPDAFPGQKTDTGAGPVVPFPKGVKSFVFYAANRDRFDDPVIPRIHGTWEKVATAPLDSDGNLTAFIPAGLPSTTVLAGLGDDGKIFKWTGASDSAGRAGTFLAIAGDHYSGTRKDGYHFCLGCHTGHTFIPVDIHERLPDK